MEYAQYTSRMLLKLSRTGKLYDPILTIPNVTKDVDDDISENSAETTKASNISKGDPSSSPSVEPEKSLISGEDQTESGPETTENVQDHPTPSEVVMEQKRKPPDKDGNAGESKEEINISPPEPDFVPAEDGGHTQIHRKVVAKHDINTPEKFRRTLAFLPLRVCLLYTSPSPRDATLSRMPSSA